MGLSSGFESNAIGGIGGPGFGGFGGGFGGIGLFGLLGLRGIGGLGDEGHHRHGDGDGCNKTLFTMKSIQDAKDSLNEAIDSVKDNLDNRIDNLKDALTSRVEGAKDQTIFEGRALGAAICDAEKTNLQQFYAAAIQAANNTQAIKDQATAFAIVADKRFDDLSAAGVTQTAAILARINDAEVQRLRDELEVTRHGLRNKEVEMNITNTNTNIQQQMQQQQQQQLVRDFEHSRRFDTLFSQVAKSSQDIINVGGLMAGVAQAANPVNVKS